MSDTPTPRQPSLGRRIVTFPLVRMGIGLVLLSLAAGLVSAVMKAGARSLFGTPVPAWANLVAAVPVVLAVLGAYLLLVRVVERRRATELEPSRALSGLVLGTAGGIGLIAAVVAVIWLLGGYRVDEVVGVAALAGPLGIALVSGFAEELVFRGVLFRITEEALGSWIALALTSALFGAVHLGNPNATVWSAVAIAVEAGVLLGASFMLTRSLWWPIGIHIGWNLAEGGLFGAAVSGADIGGFVRATFSGSDLLTGGPFGPEASVTAVAVCVTVSVVLLAAAVRRGRVVPPFWSRPAAAAIPETVRDA